MDSPPAPYTPHFFMFDKALKNITYNLSVDVKIWVILFGQL